jgi:hypothetical protein
MRRERIASVLAAWSRTCRKANKRKMSKQIDEQRKEEKHTKEMNNAPCRKAVAAISAIARAFCVRVPAPFGPLAAAPPEVVCASGSQLGAKQVAINHFNAMTDFPKVVHLECSGGGTFRSIDFASFGDAPEAGSEPAAGGGSVDCGRWSMVDDKACHANSSLAVVERICMNQTRCSIAVNSSVFGGDPCYGVLKSLSVRAPCGGGVVRGKQFPFQVKESGRTLWDGSKVIEGCKGIISVRPTADFVEFEVMSGDYKFEASAPPEA